MDHYFFQTLRRLEFLLFIFQWIIFNFKLPGKIWCTVAVHGVQLHQLLKSACLFRGWYAIAACVLKVKFRHPAPLICADSWVLPALLRKRWQSPGFSLSLLGRLHATLGASAWRTFYSLWTFGVGTGGINDSSLITDTWVPPQVDLCKSTAWQRLP